MRKTLKPGANFAAKMFQGSGSDQYLKELRAHFAKVLIRKPAASRKESREVYLVAKGLKADCVRTLLECRLIGCRRALRTPAPGGNFRGRRSKSPLHQRQ